MQKLKYEIKYIDHLPAEKDSWMISSYAVFHILSLDYQLKCIIFVRSRHTIEQKGREYYYSGIFCIPILHKNKLSPAKYPNPI